MTVATLPALLIFQIAYVVATASWTLNSSVRPALRGEVTDTIFFIAEVLNRLEKCFGLANHESRMRQTFVLVKYIYITIMSMSGMTHPAGPSAAAARRIPD